MVVLSWFILTFYLKWLWANLKSPYSMIWLIVCFVFLSNPQHALIPITKPRGPPCVSMWLFVTYWTCVVSRGVYYYRRLMKNLWVVPPIGQITQKIIDNTKQGFYTGFGKAELCSKMAFIMRSDHPLCFCLIFVWGKTNLG